MATVDLVRSIVEPLAAAEGADVYDVSFNGGTLAVAISRTGGIDLDTLADISRDLGERLDEDGIVGGSYTLEVTSPGLERTLRTASHFAGAVGESVTIRTLPDTDGERRVRGVVSASDDASVTVDLEDGGTRTVAIDDIERARTTFDWGPAPKPGGKSGGNKNAKSKPKNRKTP